MSPLFPRARSLFPELRSAFRMLEEAPFASLPRTLESAFPSMGGARPALDVDETEKDFRVEAEVPGVEKSDLTLSFSDDGQTLTLRGKIERSSSSPSAPVVDPADSSLHATSSASAYPASSDSKATAVEATDATSPRNLVQSTRASSEPSLWSERFTGSFSRSVRFPAPVEGDQAKASLQNGILSIVVPKRTGSESKQINIE